MKTVDNKKNGYSGLESEIIFRIFFKFGVLKN